MTDITPEAVERFIQTTMKEAVLSGGMPRNADDTKDAYATVSLLRALSARIAELEAQRSTLRQKSMELLSLLNVEKAVSATTRANALREALYVCDRSIGKPMHHIHREILALIDNEPTP